ncbi:hypothetical protein ABID22_003575 [Pontibacter aydingkolensis]|uniref:Uncharacterized protein n=1 Tax=Pontibacter aydingkolensis TaxID=1911536 RepID=A0ABS7CYH8_9BACT|nr:hypothetical protein [Pontibacter aydingkolensis]MBW7468877.1 hypothetical protein [Pontibacter aydingkolensis]
MEILNWKQKDFSGRKYIVNSADGQLGKLVFDGWTSYNAVFDSGESSVSFTSKGWVEQEVTIRYNGEIVGNGITSLLGKSRIEMVSGEKYVLQSKTFSQKQVLTDVAGKSVISFEQPAFGFGKGQILIADGVSELTKLALVSTGLYFKTVSDSQVAILIAIFTPIFLQIIR